MLIKDENTPAAGRWLAPAGIGLGVVVGVFLGYAWFGVGSGTGLPETLEGPFAEPSATEQPLPPSPLEQIRITVAEGDARILQSVRDQALRDGLITIRDVVPATVRVRDKEVPAQIRIKGDWTDHVETDKWSFRIEVEDSVLGMRRFSIQNANTRTYTLEWLFLEFARRTGVLAPRSMFVDVVVNNNRMGVYQLEEHFTKEMLESQGRRDGPIVHFDEDPVWSTFLKFRQFYTEHERGPVLVAQAREAWIAEVDAFDEKRLTRVDELNQRLHRALDQLRDAQRILIQNLSDEQDLLKREALADLQGQTIDDLFDTEKLARLLALCSLFDAKHGLAQHQWRFYHDPMLDRLEPIAFDMTWGPGTSRTTELAIFDPSVKDYLRSRRYYEEVFHSLARLSEPGFLEGLLEDVRADYERFSGALAAEGELPDWCRFDVISSAMKERRAHFRRLLSPTDIAMFSCTVYEDEEAETPREVGLTQELDTVPGTLEVEAWAITLLPVTVESFRFSNGTEVTAAESVVDKKHLRDDGTVVLPREGQHVTFRFPLDKRLEYLRQVQGFKQAIREQTEPDKNIKVQISAVYRPITASESRVTPLYLRRLASPLNLSERRPPQPEMIAALDQHEFLAYDVGTDRLSVRPGEWEVDGDLLIPDGQVLYMTGGTTLRFQPGAVVLTTAPLQWVGTQTQEILLEPTDESDGWGGLVVLKSGTQRSRLEWVTIRRTKGIARGAWQTTGGVTFYASEVDLVNCRFEESLGEDALNIFGCEFTMVGVAMSGAQSDLFDGDFVQGTIDNCSFASSVGDAVDFSGSTVAVSNCTFDSIGDKCVSAGERSDVRVTACAVTSTSIAVASKDLSKVEVEGLRVERASKYVFATYIKKPEFGPSSLTATGLEMGEGVDARHLCQLTCVLEVDGKTIPGTQVDVSTLYDEDRK